jgi:hypothetical protein
MSQVIVTEALLDNIATGKFPPQKGVVNAIKSSGVPLIIYFWLENDPTSYRYYRGYGMQEIQKLVKVEREEWVRAHDWK